MCCYDLSLSLQLFSFIFFPTWMLFFYIPSCLTYLYRHGLKEFKVLKLFNNYLQSSCFRRLCRCSVRGRLFYLVLQCKSKVYKKIPVLQLQIVTNNVCVRERARSHTGYLLHNDVHCPITQYSYITLGLWLPFQSVFQWALRNCAVSTNASKTIHCRRVSNGAHANLCPPLL